MALCKFTSSGANGDPIWVNPNHVVSVKGTANGNTSLTMAVPNGDGQYHITVTEPARLVADGINDAMLVLTRGV